MKTLFVFVLLINILVAVVLFWQGTDRANDFRQYHSSIATESAQNVAESTARYIQEKQRLVELFSDNELNLISALSHDSTNQSLYTQLASRLGEYFPDHTSFALSTSQGVPLLDTLDGGIGPACLQTLRDFARQREALTRIHHAKEGDHFDIMTIYGQNQGIILISFKADILRSFLKASHTLQHELILGLNQEPRLVESTVNRQGTTILRKDMRLNDEERNRVLKIVEVPGTSWAAYDLHEPGLFENFNRYILYRSGAILLLFLGASTLFMILTYKAEKRRITAERNREEFLSTVTHELRTPLTAIRGSLSLLDDGVLGELPQQAKHFTSMALRNSVLMINLVNDLLDISKLEFGDVSLEMQPCNINKIVAHTLELNREYGAQFGVNFKLHSDNQVIFVQANRQRLIQVMSNLLSNAVKFGLANSTVDVAILILDQNVRVCVHNQGDAIPEEFQQAIFRKFSKVQQSTTANNDQYGSGYEVKGSGLGLSIVKHIVDLHQGKVGYISMQDEGTTFYFDLPILRRKLSEKDSMVSTAHCTENESR